MDIRWIRLKQAWFSLDASVSTRTTKEKHHIMTFKDKAKWLSFEMSFIFGSVLRLSLVFTRRKRKH